MKTTADQRGYLAHVEGKTCLDCIHAEKCGLKGHEKVGWCRKWGDFVDDGDLAENGIDCFEAAA